MSKAKVARNSRMIDRLRSGVYFDFLFSKGNVDWLHHAIVWVAIFGFVLHLSLIAWADLWGSQTALGQALGTNYLSAVYTPFSFVLFFEVFLLVISIVESTTSFLGRQFEILSLIVIRDAFKDISKFDGFIVNPENQAAFIDVLWDMGGGIGLFLMVTVFYHLRSTLKGQKVSGLNPKQLRRFLAFKKNLAVGLSVILIALAIQSLWGWITDAYQLVVIGENITINVHHIFYVDMFSIMIFSDVLILLTSMAFIRQYQLVIRNAGFIVATILIRFALTIDKPYDVELGLIANLFGILVLAVYSYSIRVPIHAKARRAES